MIVRGMSTITRKATRALISFYVSAFLVLAVGWFHAWAQDDLARELPRLKPLSPEQALKSFRVHAGFVLHQVATEPVVSDPVAVCYDADGRLYVVEMRGYPFPEQVPSGGVARLEDRDGDGRYETRTEFLRGLSWPTSVVPSDGGVFIAAAPDIIYARDTDGDGVADIRQVVFTGFGTENVQGLVNGLLWGPDGWIYGVARINQSTVRNPSRPAGKALSLRGRDFRFRPDGSAIEAISGGGQFGHSFDDWGHRFTCNNSNHVRQIVLPSHYLERNPRLDPPSVILDIALEGPAAPVFRISPPEPWRVVRTRQRAADPVLSKRLPPTELFATGFFTSATGITIYRGSAYPPEYSGNVFIGDVGGNLVHRKVLLPNGATYLAQRADSNVEFLASTDNWFRPVNFANTPDGTLLLIDMYREAIEHPASIPEPIKRHLDLTSGKDKGRLYELRATGGKPPTRPKLSAADTSDLVRLLAHPDAWWRETAQRLLFERHDRSVAGLLRGVAKERPTALGRLHALWTLELLEELDVDSLVLGLTDPEPRVRERAVCLSEQRLKAQPALRARVLALAADPDPMVRFQTAFSLGTINDVFEAQKALASIALRDAESPWVRAAVLSSIAGRPAELLEALCARRSRPAREGDFLSSPWGQSWLDDLAYLIGAGAKPANVSDLLARLSRSGLGSEQLIPVVLGLARGQRRAGRSFQHLLDGDAGALLRALLAQARALVDSTRPVDSRTAAIRLLGLGDPQTARGSLPSLLDAHQPVAIQLCVLHALADCFDRAVAAQIAVRWKSMSPAVRREAIEVLTGRREGIEAALDAIESHRILLSEIDPARLSFLRNHRESAVRDRATRIIAQSTSSSSANRVKLVDSFSPALALDGRRVRGREVFTKVCATCHQAEGQGVAVGPDLATVANRTPQDLLVHILDPNREVAPNYINYNVALTDGRVVSGVIAEETATAVVLKRAEGASDRVPRDQIDTITSSGVSLMPEGLEQGLSAQDFADLIAFVRSIQPAKPSAPVAAAVPVAKDRAAP
jgi:putative membrane-bound dehydrogenase-like protein